MDNLLSLRNHQLLLLCPRWKDLARSISAADSQGKRSGLELELGSAWRRGLPATFDRRRHAAPQCCSGAAGDGTSLHAGEVEPEDGLSTAERRCRARWTGAGVGRLHGG